METLLAQKFIITNVYPFSLVRRKMIAVPVEIKDVVASLKIAHDLGPGKRVVTILCDTGERYFSMEQYFEA